MCLTCRMDSSSMSLKMVPLIWLGFKATQFNTGNLNFVWIGFFIFTAVQQEMHRKGGVFMLRYGQCYFNGNNIITSVSRRMLEVWGDGEMSKDTHIDECMMMWRCGSVNILSCHWWLYQVWLLIVIKVTISKNFNCFFYSAIFSIIGNDFPPLQLKQEN